MMLSIYDPYEDVFFSMPPVRIPLRHLASELFDEFDISDEAELERILDKAFDVCISLNVPIEQHFKKVFLYKEGQISTDWLVSDMGSYLLLVNGNTRNYKTALAQMYIISRVAK